ncbi:TolC family protein [Chitinophaga nivalis]|uniref:TolC family protein n=1 Tax=Chitinophaga nivalis TaxID=2991709 RepID=A0ABT3IVR5_9BACT|nr:TolC family protein [Chitinophaga nivalis]MCW3462246.1 TolC family protein [Chitinophaga nivalis]MCW3488062.1 TolC family protein [Chitinophaga nivalis]
MNIWKPLCLLVFAASNTVAVMGQSDPLTLQEALQTGLKNYQSIKAKENYAKAATENISAVRREYLPDLNLAAQNSYGTINGQNGPTWAYKGWSTGASGPALPSQNWNAAFGGLYLANISWDVVTFGRQRAKVVAAQAQYNTNIADLEQEKFEQQIRIAGAYLNLLAAQRLRGSMESNLKRAEDLRRIILNRALNGLSAGVDSSIANAEVSKARLTLVDAVNYESVQSNKLAEMMDVLPQTFVLDTTFVTRIPQQLLETVSAKDTATLQQQPLLKLFNQRVLLSEANQHSLSKNAMPRLSFMSVLQTRGSGFESDYSAANTSSYSKGYWDGIHPQRTNYLVGLNLSWTVTDLWRTKAQVARQEYTTAGLKNEYTQTYNRLQHQLSLSEEQIENAVRKYREAPVGLKAASDAFLQKSTLYENGLSNIADLSQALYNINRAETDRDIAYNGVWQAILYKSATIGDLQLFLHQL